MREKHKVRTPPDNYGRVYIGLLETPLSASAKLCYGVMWSFGQEACWASIEAIAKRMSVAEGTARKAREELHAAKWIKLLEDSKGRNVKTWEMVTPATRQAEEATPQLLETNPSTIDGLTPQPLHPNKEGKQEEKQETLPQAALPIKIAIAAFCEYRKQVGRYPSYSCTGKDAGAVKALLKNNPELTVDEWRAGFAAFYKEDPTFTGQHSLSCYANTFNKYKTITPKKRWDQL